MGPLHATVKHFLHEYGETNLSVLAIGAPGEKQVRFGAWINETDRASGRNRTIPWRSRQRVKGLAMIIDKALEPVHVRRHHARAHDCATWRR